MVAFPVNAAVIVPAEKLPEASRETIVLAVLVLVAASNSALSAALILPAVLVVAAEIEITGAVPPLDTIGEVPVTPVTVPVVGVDHCGAVAPEFMVNTCPAVPFASRVPVPLVPPYIISPAVVIGDKASKAAVFVVAPVPPFARLMAVPFQVPVAMVPRVVIFDEPTQVERAVFSTFPKPTSPLTSVTTPVFPATEVTGAAGNVAQLNEPAVAPAVNTLPLLPVPVAGTCKLPSPVGCV